MMRTLLEGLRLPGPGAPPPPRAKALLFRAGRRLSDRTVYGLLGLFNYIHLGWWLKQQQFPVHSVVDDRFQVFDRIAQDVGDEPLLYLEFGVADGHSMRYYSQLLEGRDAMLHGFDSFEGLPSEWAVGWPESVFTRGGSPPEFDDERVKMFAGWFNETLPRYEWPEDGRRLVVGMDADLYSSTVYVLETIESRLSVGTIIYFDEFHHFADELRAFTEFLGRTGWQFEILAATRDFSQLAFKRTA